jgi:hypothetical protein
MRDDFGMVDRYDDRCYKSGAAQDTKQRAHARDKRSDEQTERQ